MTAFHPLHLELPMQKCMDDPFQPSAHQGLRMAERAVAQYLEMQPQWRDEIARGKMFGTLIVQAEDGGAGFLAAYSGQLAGRGDHPFFVPAVFYYLQPDGYFKRHEAEITSINRSIEHLEQEPRVEAAKMELKRMEDQRQKAIEEYKNVMQRAKARRDELRSSTGLSAEQEAEMVRESQHQKAELKRMRKALMTGTEPLTSLIGEYEENLRRLKVLRRQLSESLQQWLFSQFKMLNWRGESLTLLEIFEQSTQQLPPAGAGECCAPKLLQYAFAHRLRPVALSEIWFGASPKSEIRHHGHRYTPCRGKCKPILDYMLRGMDLQVCRREEKRSLELEILYEDAEILAINKPSGLLSVPGKDDVPDVLSLMRAKYPGNIELTTAHRLDMDTSGVLILAKNKQSFQSLQRQFTEHQVEKDYLALVRGVPEVLTGTVELPLRPSFTDRPRQVVDHESGKRAVTRFQCLKSGNGLTFMKLQPCTGRTHQLRVHCAHAGGLACPIVGDRLYGSGGGRLMLHAESITFSHPKTGEEMTIKAPLPREFHAFGVF